MMQDTPLPAFEDRAVVTPEDLPAPARVAACARYESGEPFSEACSCSGRAAWAWFETNAPTHALRLVPEPRFDLRGQEPAAAREPPAPGTEAVEPEVLERMPPGITLAVASDLLALEAELALLEESLLQGPHGDGVVGLDFEWAPSFHFKNDPSVDPSKGRPISLIQLAAQTRVLLVRLCCLPGDVHDDGTFDVPPCLAAFFANPRLQFVGFDVHSNDAAKVQETFGVAPGALVPPCGDAPRLFDACAVAGAMGYPSASLARLSQCLFNVVPPKSSSVTCSNWEAEKLNMRQRRYAAIDAWLVAEAFRGLRWWHARQRAKLLRPSEAMHSAASLEDFQRAVAATPGGADEPALRTHCDACAAAFGTVFAGAPASCPVDGCGRRFKKGSGDGGDGGGEAAQPTALEACDAATWQGALQRQRFFDHVMSRCASCLAHTTFVESAVCLTCGRFHWTAAMASIATTCEAVE